MPELLDLVKEVEATKTPRELRRNNKQVALLTIGASSPLIKSRIYRNGRRQKKLLSALFPGISAGARNCLYG
jgi:hypothetical protein